MYLQKPSGIFFFASLLIVASCTTAKLPVSDDFKKESTALKVSGLNGWQVGQKLSVGGYQTSSIKRGWDFSSSVQYTKFFLRPEEALARVFNIDTDKARHKQKGNFQYTLEADGMMAEIWATEKFSDQQLVYKSNNPWIGGGSKTFRYDYAFTAGVIPLGPGGGDPWSLVLINRYDINKDTARGIFSRPYVEEEGYATNGKESFAIRPLRLNEVEGGDGKKRKVLGGPVLAGYELQRDGRVVALIDILEPAVWLHNGLQPQEKLLLSSFSSAILLKRMQDVEKERE